MGRAVLPRRDEQWATPVRSILAAEEQNSDHKHTICYSVHTVVTVYHIRVAPASDHSWIAKVWFSTCNDLTQPNRARVTTPKINYERKYGCTVHRCVNTSALLQTIGIWCLKMCTTIRRRHLNTQMTPYHVWNFFITLVPFRAKSFQLLPRHRKTNLDKNI